MHVYLYLYTYMYQIVSVCVYVSICMCMLFVSICMCICICIFVCVCVSIKLYTYLSVSISIYVFVYIFIGIDNVCGLRAWLLIVPSTRGWVPRETFDLLWNTNTIFNEFLLQKWNTTLNPQHNVSADLRPTLRTIPTNQTTEKTCQHRRWRTFSFCMEAAQKRNFLMGSLRVNM